MHTSCRARVCSTRRRLWSRSISLRSLCIWYAYAFVQLPPCSSHSSPLCTTPSELIQHRRARLAQADSLPSLLTATMSSYFHSLVSFWFSSQVFLIGGIFVSCLLIFHYGRRELLLGAFAAACFGTFFKAFLYVLQIWLFIMLFNMQMCTLNLADFWDDCITGTVTVLSAKAFSGMVRLTFAGSNQIASPVFWIALILLILGAVFQVLYVHDIFPFLVHFVCIYSASHHSVLFSINHHFSLPYMYSVKYFYNNRPRIWQCSASRA